mmetsp:Transcript_4544/g.11909  ORF Transcript_4544/g.11909 Transcript_4544/m.11909 type:complete len:278 (-) Transcript_4544:322-1155(-)|eukprot:CAMPEP_0198116604 /NCGR_PEP_ID=MMETSP1442-20131203/13485_1 /TAXON_ID= /ORGANISM="Craspedostauros australis, Strain CCMP3328" /LENGTH=277 /DNA_ID=CAMNT_0043774469 /DNA_START=61 /DNA_END=894 /DNA_ORIENTATION=-
MTANWDAIEKELGPGPMRFAGKKERTVQEQLAALTKDERRCVDELRSKMKEKKDMIQFDDEMLLRFARCSPGTQKFNTKASWKVMKKFDARYLTLRAKDLEQQLLSETLFPVPGLQTKEGGHDVFYMRPSRYFPKTTSTQAIIDNLAYCMSTMVEKEKACTEGIGFVANMDNWHMSNFSISYCLQFMKMLQGRIPVRVRLFLIVNPPSWFDTIWSIMKPMLASDFRKKVHMIPEDKLGEFFAEGYEAYMPNDDIQAGKASMKDMVQDFVAYRKRIEA